MMATEYGDTISPPDTYWTIQDELDLVPGEWADIPTRYYEEEDAVAEAQKRARDNYIKCRVVKHMP